MSASLPKRKVDPLNNATDFEVLLLAELGMSGKFIAGATRLSLGQAYYRTRKAGIRLADYRNGISRASNIILASDAINNAVSFKLRTELESL